MNVQLWISLLPWLCLFASSTPNVINNTNNTFGFLRNVCIFTVPQTVAYYEHVTYTRVVRTESCRLIVLFCRTVYRLQRQVRLQKKTKIVNRPKARCCDGFVKEGNLCVSITTPAPSTTSMSTSETIPNTSNFPYYDEVHITSGSSKNIILAVVISMVVAACIIAAIIVAYRRKKKTEKAASEIPCDREVLSLPPNSRNNCWDLPEGLSCNVTGPEEENYYVSMNNGFDSDTPNVNKMLSTRGSRYRFADLEEENCGSRLRTDTLYVLHDPKSGQGDVNSCGMHKEPEQYCGSSSNIYINEWQESSEENSASNDADDIYTEVKSNTNSDLRPLHYVTYEDIDQNNKTDVNGNGRCGANVKGLNMELKELQKNNNKDTYNIPKYHFKELSSGHHDDDDDGDDSKNNNGDDSTTEASHSKTCDSGIYIYLNSKEEEESETDFIYSVPYSHSNNNNDSSPQYTECIDTQHPSKQQCAAVQSHVYQNSMFNNEDADHCYDVAEIKTSSS